MCKLKLKGVLCGVASSASGLPSFAISRQTPKPERRKCNTFNLNNLIALSSAIARHREAAQTILYLYAYYTND